MKTSIATVSISGQFFDKINAIAEAGFDGVEIFEQDFIANERSPREIGDMVRDFGLDITLFQPFRDFEGLPEPQRGKAFERAKRKFDLMNELGTELMLICSSVHEDAMGGIDRAVNDFGALGDLAKAFGVRVGYEALAWGKYVSDHRDAWEVVRRVDHPNVGIILDSFHTLARKIDPAQIRSIPGDKIFFVQLADAPLIEMDLLYWSRHFRNMPGEGGLDVMGFMRSVMATGYAGPISLEIFNDEFRGGRPRLVAKDGYRSLIALMDDVRREEPALKIDLPDIPARSECHGVEFIEFASRGEQADELRQIFAAMGFAKAGRHRAKSIELWRQGDANLLINEEASDYAGVAFDLHGSCVCDIGFRVGNSREAVERAVALGAKLFDPQAPEGFLDLPAIRGTNGIVLHFLDADAQARIWDVDFELDAGMDENATLNGIDHIAQTMLYEEMLSSTLFYKTLFDMDASALVDVIDPDGLVRSNALESRDKKLRLTLNGAQAHKTLAGKFLKKSFGAPVQHIAFSTDNIFEAARNLGELGFASLPMSANYYDDLRARFVLDDEQIERLKTHFILYDEDKNGRFYQLYSKPIFGGFFFEITQRVDGYEGYAASNAPFRIAAQKRTLSAMGMPQDAFGE